MTSRLPEPPNPDAAVPRVLPVRGHPGSWHCLEHKEFKAALGVCQLCEGEAS